jgi:signal transduction histidine kinase
MAPAGPDHPSAGGRLRRSRVGVRGRVFGWYAALLVVAALASLFLQRQVLMSQANRDLSGELAEEARQLEERLRQGADPATREPWPDLRTALDSYLGRTLPEEGEAFITLLGAELHRDDQGLTNLPPVRALLEDWGALDRTRTGEVGTARGTLRHLAVPIRYQDQEATFVVTIFTGRHTKPIADALRVGATVWISIVAVASLVAWLLAGHILRPIRDLTEAAEEINETDLSRRIAGGSEDEIGRLSATFNRMLDRLEAAFASQRAFIDTTGHELRTPLTVARGHLELLKDDPSDVDDCVDLVTEELDRMARLVSDLLMLARLERPGFLEPEEYALEALTRRAYEKVRTLGERDWRLEAVGQATLYADPQRLTQLVLILGENAMHYADPSSPITMGSEADDHVARIWVADYGPGVAEEDYERIFTTYGRGEEGAGRREGLGLGLSIARRIAEAHGGSLALDRAYNDGARFVATIPTAGSKHSTPRKVTNE